MKAAFVLTALSTSLLFGCATPHQTVDEAPRSIKISASAIEVQEFLEDWFLRSGEMSHFRVDQATDREITFKANCNEVPNMGSLKCALIMMGIGNSGWTGPELVMTFRTSQIRDSVSVSVSASWCATNAFNKTNCSAAASNKELNGLLEKLDVVYPLYIDKKHK